MTSGGTNSGDPYLLYCGSAEVIFWAKPKSQILMSSRAGCTIRMLEGYWAVGEWVRPHPKEVTPRAVRRGGTFRSVRGCPTKMVQPGGGEGGGWATLGAGFSTIWGWPLFCQSHITPAEAAGKVVSALFPKATKS